MKTFSNDLQTAQEARVHRFAMCFKSTWKNGTIRGFTTHTRKISIDGVIYKAASGFDPLSVRSSSDMNVDGLEIAGAVKLPAIVPKEVMEAYWDGAKIEVFEIVYNNTGAGRNILRKGYVGAITTKGMTFTAEFRGLMHKLQQTQGRVIGELCDHNFCDFPIQARSNAKCGLAAATYTVTGTTDDITAVCDALYDQVVSFIPFQGVDGQTSVKDYVGNEWGAIGTIVVSDDQAKYGTTSMYFPGSGSYLAAQEAWGDLGDDDFTIEGWVRVPSLPTAGNYYGLFNKRASAAINNCFTLYIRGDDSKVGFSMSTSGVATTGVAASDAVITTNTWHYVTVERYNGFITVYVNGVGGTPYNIGAAALFDSSQAPAFGLLDSSTPTSHNLVGYLNHWRVTIGAARYQGNFTPPTARLNYLDCALLEGNRRFVVDTERTELDGFFTFGRIEFTSSTLDGLSSKIKSSVPGILELVDAMPRDIPSGVTYSLMRGCAKTPEACEAYGNMINNGAFKNVPTPNSNSEGP